MHLRFEYHKCFKDPVGYYPWDEIMEYSSYDDAQVVSHWDVNFFDDNAGEQIKGRIDKNRIKEPNDYCIIRMKSKTKLSRTYKPLAIAYLDRNGEINLSIHSRNYYAHLRNRGYSI